MKLLLKAVLIKIAVLLVISSWTTVSSAQILLGGENASIEDTLRLISMDMPPIWTPSADVKYWATIEFEAGYKPEIRRACFNFSGGSQSCVKVDARDVASGQFRVPVHVPEGTKRIDCYAEYIRGRETQRTNTITYHVVILKKERKEGD